MTCWRKPQLKYLLWIPAYFLSLAAVMVLIIGGAALNIVTIGAFNFDCAYRASGRFLDWVWDRIT